MLTVAPNSGAPRSATISVAGIFVPVSQDGPAPPLGIATNGVVSLDSAISTIQPGSWISIYGSNLASGTYAWNGDFPKSLGGVSVTINDKPGYLSFVGPSQLNLQAPDDTGQGLVNVVVSTPEGSVASSVRLASYAPSFCLLDSQHVAAVIPTPDRSYEVASPSNPVSGGEVVELYGVGFGPTNPPVPAGQSFSGSAPVTGKVSVTIGGIAASVQFAGITSAGLYQLNVVVPDGLISGDQPVHATVGGAGTQDNVYISVQ